MRPTGDPHDLGQVVLANPLSTARAVADLASATVADARTLVSACSERGLISDLTHDNVDTELQRRAGALTAGESPRSAASPGFYQWYFRLLGAVFDNDTERARKALRSAPGLRQHRTFEAAARGPLSAPTTVQVVYQSEVVDRAAADYSASYSSQYGHPVVIAALAPDEFQLRQPGAERIGRLGAAIELIEAVWPSAAATLELCTVDVALLTGPYFVGGSDLACFGTSFLNLRTDWSVLCSADHLLHEAAHQAMHAFGEINPPLDNPAEVGKHSPIRPDPRPLYGTLHATVVFSWLVELCLQVLTDPPDEATRGEAEIRLHRHLLGLYEGVRSLETHASWTEAGQILRDQLDERVSTLRLTLGEPSEVLYEQMPDDYERPSAIAALRDG